MAARNSRGGMGGALLWNACCTRVPAGGRMSFPPCYNDDEEPRDPSRRTFMIGSAVATAGLFVSPALTAQIPPKKDDPHAIPITLNVNGKVHTLKLDPRTTLLDALREHLGLTGAKKGCDQGACGACTVLADGERINACLALAVQYTDREITTIEGVDDPIQEAFVRTDGFQCGYCTSGQICSAIGMLAEFKDGAPSAVTEHLAATGGELT